MPPSSHLTRSSRVSTGFMSISSRAMVHGFRRGKARTLYVAPTDEQWMSRSRSTLPPALQQRGSTLHLRRVAFRERREPAIEAVVLGGHVGQELGRLETRSASFFQRFAKCDKALGAHGVDEGERPAGKRRKPEAENRAD